MTAVLLTRLSAFLFGDGLIFEPYASHVKGYGTGRLFISLSWTSYRKWGGLFRGYRHRAGVMEVTVAFNPGMPDFMFKLACQSDDLPEHVVVVESSDALAIKARNGEDIEDEVEERSDRINWRFKTVIRKSEDIMGLHRWIESLQSQLHGDEDELDAPFTPDETEMTKDVLGVLTERFATCQLNS